VMLPSVEGSYNEMQSKATKLSITLKSVYVLLNWIKRSGERIYFEVPSVHDNAVETGRAAPDSQIREMTSLEITSGDNPHRKFRKWH